MLMLVLNDGDRIVLRRGGELLGEISVDRPHRVRLSLDLDGGVDIERHTKDGKVRARARSTEGRKVAS